MKQKKGLHKTWNPTPAETANTPTPDQSTSPMKQVNYNHYGATNYS